jgi:hypothetical protein
MILVVDYRRRACGGFVIRLLEEQESQRSWHVDISRSGVSYASATTLVSVLNTGVFRKALTALTGPRTL